MPQKACTFRQHFGLFVHARTLCVARRAATDLWVQQEIPRAQLVHSSARTRLSRPRAQAGSRNRWAGLCALGCSAAGSWVGAGRAVLSALRLERGCACPFCLVFTTRGNQSGHFIYPFGLFVFGTDRHCPLRLQD